MLNLKCYERCEIEVENGVTEVVITDDNKNEMHFLPFLYQPISVSYDEEGIETIKKDGAPVLKVRFTLKNEGNYTLKEIYDGKTEKETLKICVSGYENNGYVCAGKDDKRYFEYSNGKSFFAVGINLTYPISYESSDGTEFGTTSQKKYIGLNQYERWIKRCSENGVNLIRLWVGHNYFSPDTLNVYEFNYEKFSILDKVIDIAKKYNVKLKLTLEQYRYFAYGKDSGPSPENFKKQLWIGDEKCNSIKTWLTSEKWKNAWLNKVLEFSKRYSGDTEIFAIELWNEMNCCGDGYLEWNKEMLPKVKALFKDNMVVNSLGSLDSEKNIERYKNFCWDKCDFKQVHKYLDQGAKLSDSRNNLIEVAKSGIEYIKSENQPAFLAETGAVNNCHSGPFKYYHADDRGIIFVDSVYTPLFAGAAGSGNIWHWDGRYVEGKNLYKYFKPLSDLICGVDFARENFSCCDLSDSDVYLLCLKGKNVTLGFIRNKTDNWKNTLRDMNEPTVISEKSYKTDGKSLKLFPIWTDDTTSAILKNGEITFKNIRYGTLFKINNTNG